MSAFDAMLFHRLFRSGSRLLLSGSRLLPVVLFMAYRAGSFSSQGGVEGIAGFALIRRIPIGFSSAGYAAAGLVAVGLAAGALRWASFQFFFVAPNRLIYMTLRRQGRLLCFKRPAVFLCPEWLFSTSLLLFFLRCAPARLAERAASALQAGQKRKKTLPALQPHTLFCFAPSF